MKKLLLTGGTGTVGSAFIEAYAEKYDISVLSRNEKLQHELRQRFPRVRCFLGSVEDKEALYNVYDHVSPEIVVHAAALKHVDVAERDPIQTANVNIVGSLNVIDASVLFGVPVTVAVSTDKACNHQNIYGMSKYLMERFSMQANTSRTRFAACRFANVAHSNGSVIPLWLRMAADNQPLKITDARMNRMMFSKTEAAALVAKAISMCEDGDGGFVLSKQMKSVNMLDLAKAISDNVVEIGQRPGEKLDEDLISEAELPFTQLMAEGYIRLGGEPTTDGQRLARPLNTQTAEKMTPAEILKLVSVES